jgi:Fe-S cluster biogenesis protein NfuA/nitrite reductase/ring-hydroxylating ferredoxin subunit
MAFLLRPCSAPRVAELPKPSKGTNAPYEPSVMPSRSNVSLDELNSEGKRIQELIARISEVPDPSSRAMLEECLESLLCFYGKGLARILELVEEAGPEGREVYRLLIEDGAVRGLLLIHGLHPVPLETRLREALDKIRPYMESHGGNVELLSLDGDVARLRLQGHCKTCPSSAVTMELAIRGAIEEACPDLLGFEVEGVEQPSANAHMLHVPNGAPAWIEVTEARGLDEGTMVCVHKGDFPLVVCKHDNQLYAYRDHCPACNMPLHLGAFESGVIACSLGHRYDVHRAGKSLDRTSVHLDPLPLLARDGSVRVAFARESTEDHAPSRASP